MVQCAKGVQAALIVDGYNVMMQWVEEPGQKHLKSRIGASFSYVREAFLREVSAYTSKELRVMVAFDAIGNLAAPPLNRYAPSPSACKPLMAVDSIASVGCGLVLVRPELGAVLIKRKQGLYRLIL